jgi:hypothetical protein
MKKKIENLKLAEVINFTEAKKARLKENDEVKDCSLADFHYSAEVNQTLLFKTREEAFRFYRDNEEDYREIFLYEGDSKTPIRESLIFEELGVPKGIYSDYIWSVTERGIES